MGVAFFAVLDLTVTKTAMTQYTSNHHATIDVQNEHAIPLAEVHRHVPKRRGKRVHYSTVYRWATKGARGRVLATVMVGGVRFTTVEAIARFLESKSTVHKSGAISSVDDEIEEALRQAGV